MITDITNMPDFERLLDESKDRPVLILKHSTACPCSALAWRIFQEFAENNPEYGLYRVLVRENRDVSLEIADRIDLEHQSPQILLLSDARLVWNKSHFSITADSISEAIVAIKST